MRLRYSYSGFLRRMQMSSKKLFVFVEGKNNDPYFYGEVCNAVVNDNIEYQICKAEELPGETGGKTSLISFFIFLRKKRALSSEFKESRTTCIFYLDKDIDDLQGTRKRSPHVVYTEYYDVENYIFEFGNIITGAAAAASIDAQLIRAIIADSSSWCSSAAEKWKDWIKLCIFAKKTGISCGTNYRVISKINNPISGLVDNHEHRDRLSNLRRLSGLTVQEFDDRHTKVCKRVDFCFEHSKHHRVFKGKWFSSILEDEIQTIMRGKKFHSVGLANRLTSTIMSTLEFENDWADYFKQPLDRIIRYLN